MVDVTVSSLLCFECSETLSRKPRGKFGYPMSRSRYNKRTCKRTLAHLYSPLQTRSKDVIITVTRKNTRWSKPFARGSSNVSLKRFNGLKEQHTFNWRKCAFHLATYNQLCPAAHSWSRHHSNSTQAKTMWNHAPLRSASFISNM